jgi:glycolate oxidase FAD binding subunit
MLRPMSEADIADLIRGASQPFWITGQSTRRTGPGVALETTGLSGVTLYEPAALTLVVRAGTPLVEVEALLASEGQRLAFEPPLHGTIGGMVAMNASGPRAVQVGTCRDFVIGARFVDGSGNVIKSGGRVMKNVTGYDLARMMCGAGGTLGVLTEVAFKVLPMPETQMTLRLKTPLQEAPALMSKALGTPWEVSGAAWLNGEVWLRIEGFADQVSYRSTHLAALFPGAHADPKADWSKVRASGLNRITTRPSQAAAVLASLPEGEVILDHGGATILTEHPALPVPESPAVQALKAGLKAKFDPENKLNRAA